MRTAILALFAAVLSVSTLAPGAESTQPPAGFSLFAGFARPTGELNDYWRTNFSFGGNVSYQATDHLAVEIVAANGQRFGLDGRRLLIDSGLDPSLATITGGTVNVFSLTGGIRINSENAFGAGKADLVHHLGHSPYAALGAGFYRVSVSDASVSAPGLGFASVYSNSENAFGLNLGGGFENRISQRSTIFLELRYHIVFTDGESLSFVPVHGGARFNW